MCQVLENRSRQDEERMDQLTNQLKEARLLAEDADGKSDEVIDHICNLTEMKNFNGGSYRRSTLCFLESFTCLFLS